MHLCHDLVPHGKLNYICIMTHVLSKWQIKGVTLFWHLSKHNLEQISFPALLTLDTCRNLTLWYEHGESYICQWVALFFHCLYQFTINKHGCLINQVIILNSSLIVTLNVVVLTDNIDQWKLYQIIDTTIQLCCFHCDGGSIGKMVDSLQKEYFLKWENGALSVNSSICKVSSNGKSLNIGNKLIQNNINLRSAGEKNKAQGILLK